MDEGGNGGEAKVLFEWQGDSLSQGVKVRMNASGDCISETWSLWSGVTSEDCTWIFEIGAIVFENGWVDVEWNGVKVGGQSGRMLSLVITLFLKFHGFGWNEIFESLKCFPSCEALQPSIEISFFLCFFH